MDELAVKKVKFIIKKIFFTPKQYKKFVLNLKVWFYIAFSSVVNKYYLMLVA